MPKEVHDALKKSADEKGLKGEERNRYIHGKLQKSYSSGAKKRALDAYLKGKK